MWKIFYFQIMCSVLVWLQEDASLASGREERLSYLNALWKITKTSVRTNYFAANILTRNGSNTKKVASHCPETVIPLPGQSV
jgi:hypothetical protein